MDISHLLYADDMLLFSNGQQASIERCMGVIAEIVMGTVCEIKVPARAGRLPHVEPCSQGPAYPPQSGLLGHREGGDQRGRLLVGCPVLARKHGWRVFDQSSENRLNHPKGLDRILSRIWHRWIPPKISVFLWRLKKLAVGTDDQVQKCGIPLASMCRCCDPLEVETTEHLFVLNKPARLLWAFGRRLFGIRQP
ncbi:hypothetical protein QQ045_031912 [Rhodiola kirilowii]